VLVAIIWRELWVIFLPRVQIMRSNNIPLLMSNKAKYIMNNMWKILVILVTLFTIVGCNATPTKNFNQEGNLVMKEKEYFLPKEKIKNLIPDMLGCFATDRIMVDGLDVGYMYRETTTRDYDSGWRFFAGDETQEYIDDLSHTSIYKVNTIANYDPDIIPYLDTSPPCAFEKIKDTHEYRLVKDE
jgi:hypothetical protein